MNLYIRQLAIIIFGLVFAVIFTTAPVAAEGANVVRDSNGKVVRIETPASETGYQQAGENAQTENSVSTVSNPSPSGSVTLQVTTQYGMQLTVTLSSDRTLLTVCDISNTNIAFVALYVLDPNNLNTLLFQVPQILIPQSGCVTFTAPFTTYIYSLDTYQTFSQFPTGAYLLELRNSSSQAIDTAEFSL